MQWVQTSFHQYLSAMTDEERILLRGEVPELSSPGIVLGGEASFLRRAEAVIAANVADENFRVGMLARTLAVSRSLLYRRLVEFGWSPADLILEGRLCHAAELLRSGVASIYDVALLAGFRSASHFCQRFRERFGETPSAFRRSASCKL